MYCKKCNTNKIVKAGFVRRYQRYKCKECDYYFTDTPVRGHSFQEKLLSLLLYTTFG